MNLPTFDELHARIEDERLDDIARAAGWSSGIGRLSLTDDAVLDDTAAHLALIGARDVLDLGCGRGLFGRWLQQRGAPLRYVGVDSAPRALEAARRLVPAGRFVCADYRKLRGISCDAAVIFDALFEDGITLADAAQFASTLNPGGSLTIGQTLLLQEQRSRFEASIAALRHASFDVEERDWTPSVRRSARSAAEAWMSCDWPSPLAQVFRPEGRAVLRALHAGTFAYLTIRARRTTNRRYR